MLEQKHCTIHGQEILKKRGEIEPELRSTIYQTTCSELKILKCCVHHGVPVPSGVLGGEILLQTFPGT